MNGKANNKLIAYAMRFASYIVEQGVNARRIILFGSVASGKSDKESDIDLFIDIDKRNVEKVAGSLSGLQKSFEKAFGEKWKLKGVYNPLSLTAGDVNAKEWDDLRRAIQSYGILLYGSYVEPPKNLQHYLLFSLNFQKLSRAKKVSIWRRLYGYTQKVGSKSYNSTSLLEQLGGMKVDKGVVLVPAASSARIKEFLSNNRISYNMAEVWSDQFRAGTSS